MKLLNKIILIIFFITPTLGSIQNNLYIRSNASTKRLVNVAVLVSNIADPYIAQMKHDLENIQINNPNTVKFTFFDAKSNQSIQNETLDSLLSNNIDLFLVNLVDTNANVMNDYIEKVKPKNLPLLLLNSEPPIITNKMKEYQKFAIITTYPREAGTLQGKLIAEEWNKHKTTIDKNRDNIMQYIMLQGELDNIGAIERTHSSISTIENAGIKTQQLALQISNWNQELAKNAIETMFYKYDNGIEVIIANNDAMAIGAIEALQKFGYNKGDTSNYIPVFGIDGIQVAQDLIKKGIMAGTVVEDPNDTAIALYTIGLNLVNNKPPLEDTPYKFDKTGFIVRIPYRGTLSNTGFTAVADIY
ncbi:MULTISPECIES: galactose ABC transporter substrate-binding protein [unclassified Clostridium]|uniref:galactose ABC transporter substrate-binding protein n=1 Tax=unclassified Clostridium TaxID=2614128 RepID=UPI000298671A|nr:MULTISPECIES: galactose ABC transporter substrate-binding protein [unclassified Clostridium]EKQ57632.1 MAG: ABC-type sugar transport system, periplasmic component [Clostridium sp. Maddingley MBC34-26]